MNVQYRKLHAVLVFSARRLLFRMLLGGSIAFPMGLAGQEGGNAPVAPSVQAATSPAPAQATGDSLVDDFARAAKRLEKEAKAKMREAVADEALDQAGKVSKKDAKNLIDSLNDSNKSLPPDARRINRMYNQASKGSDDQRRLNELWNDAVGSDPNKAAAARRELDELEKKYPPPPSPKTAGDQPPATSGNAGNGPASTTQTATSGNIPVLPSKSDLLTEQENIQARIKNHDDYIKWLQERSTKDSERAVKALQDANSSPEERQKALQDYARWLKEQGGKEKDIEGSVWVLDNDKRRLEQVNRMLEKGEYRGGSADSTSTASAGAPAKPSAARTPATPGAPGESAATPPPVTESSDQALSPDKELANAVAAANNAARRKLTGDLEDLQGQADASTAKIKGLQKQIDEARNNTPLRRQLEAQLAQERERLADLNGRVRQKIGELGAIPATPQQPPPTRGELDGDVATLQGQADAANARIRQLQQQILEARNNTPLRRQLETQLAQEQTTLNALNTRIREKIAQVGATPPTAEPHPPATLGQLDGDVATLQGQADAANARIKDLQKQIEEARNNSTLRRQLEAQLAQERTALSALNTRIKQKIDQMGATPPAAEPQPPRTSADMAADNQALGEQQGADYDKIVELQRQIAAARNNGPLRRKLEAELARLRGQVGAAETRMGENEALLNVLPPTLGAKPTPTPAASSGADDAELQEAVAAANARIAQLRQQIAEARNYGARRVELQGQLAVEQAALDALRARMRHGAGGLAAQEPTMGPGGGDTSGASPLDRMIGSRQSRSDSRTESALGLMEDNRALTQASTSGDEQLAGVEETVDRAGRGARQTRMRSAQDTAASDRSKGWGATLVGALTEGLEAGGKAFGETVGRGAGTKATEHIFGPGHGGSSSTTSTSSGNTNTGTQTSSTGTGGSQPPAVNPPSSGTGTTPGTGAGFGMEKSGKVSIEFVNQTGVEVDVDVDHDNWVRGVRPGVSGSLDEIPVGQHNIHWYTGRWGSSREVGKVTANLTEEIVLENGSWWRKNSYKLVAQQGSGTLTKKP